MAETKLIGGTRRQVRVLFDPVPLAARQLTRRRRSSRGCSRPTASPIPASSSRSTRKSLLQTGAVPHAPPRRSAGSWSGFTTASRSISTKWPGHRRTGGAGQLRPFRPGQGAAGRGGGHPVGGQAARGQRRRGGGTILRQGRDPQGHPDPGRRRRSASPGITARRRRKNPTNCCSTWASPSSAWPC